MVYEDAEKLYAEVKRDGEKMVHDALSALLDGSDIIGPQSTADNVAVVNTVPFQRLEVVSLPFSASSALANVRSQVSATPGKAFALASAGEKSIGQLVDSGFDIAKAATGKFYVLR